MVSGELEPAQAAKAEVPRAAKAGAGLAGAGAAAGVGADGFAGEGALDRRPGSGGKPAYGRAGEVRGGRGGRASAAVTAAAEAAACIDAPEAEVGGARSLSATEELLYL